MVSEEELEEIPAGSRPFDQPLVCTRSSLKALLNSEGQQRYPAKIIVSKVKLSGGEEREGVAFAALPPPPWLSSMKEEEAKYIDVDGVRTRYYDKGEGDALLLVHGGQAAASGSNAWTWQQNFDELSEYFHVYAMERLGQGYTPCRSARRRRALSR